jgi:hypothetical protein
MRAKGLRATGCNSAIRAINAYAHWASAGSEVKCSPASSPLGWMLPAALIKSITYRNRLRNENPDAKGKILHGFSPVSIADSQFLSVALWGPFGQEQPALFYGPRQRYGAATCRFSFPTRQMRFGLAEHNPCHVWGEIPDFVHGGHALKMQRTEAAIRQFPGAAEI